MLFHVCRWPPVESARSRQNQSVRQFEASKLGGHLAAQNTIGA